MLLAPWVPSPAAAAQAPRAAASADVASLEIAPDGARVFYTADPDVDESFELFSVPITGGPSRRLNPRPVAGGDVRAYAVSPDSRRVAFVGDLDADEVFELYAASSAGRPPTRLSPSLVTGGDVSDFSISPDSQRVVFRANAERIPVVELYSAPLSGGPAVKLSLALTVRRTVGRFWIAPAGERVVYEVVSRTSDARELFSVPIGGGPSAALGPTLGSQLDVVLSPSSKYVVCSQGLGLAHLFSVPIAGGPAVELTEPRFGSIHSVTIHPDGTRVLYIGDPGFGDAELASVPITGGPTTTLSVPLQAMVEEYQVSPDGRWAIYQFERGDANLGLHSVHLERRTHVELAGPGVFDFSRITPDSKRVLFAMSVPSSPFDFWSSPIGSGPPTPLEGTSLYSLQVSPDARFAVSMCGAFPGSPYTELFSVPVLGGERVRVNAPLVAGGNVRDFRISPGSLRVAYLADQDVRGRIELYSAPIDGGDGSGSAVQLNPEYP